MAESVKVLPNEILDHIELKVWNICTLEGLNRKKALNVVRIPSLTINNKVVFESIIPERDEIIDVINEYIANMTKV